MTKIEIQQVLDDVQETLENVYKPEASREEIAEAVGEALDLINPPEEEDEDEGADEAEDEDEK